MHPGSDIMERLEEHVYNEVLELNTHILDTFPEDGLSTSETWHYKTSQLEDLQFIDSNICTLRDSACVTKYFIVLK